MTERTPTTKAGRALLDRHYRTDPDHHTVGIEYREGRDLFIDGILAIEQMARADEAEALRADNGRMAEALSIVYRSLPIIDGGRLAGEYMTAESIARHALREHSRAPLATPAAPEELKS
jgi:hypothetical protein